MRNASLVLLSGGLDSVYAFTKAHQETDIIFALTFDYGQRSREREIATARELCKRYDVAHKVVTLPFFNELSGHPLFDIKADCPDLGLKNLDNLKLAEQSAKAVWVPNRNGIFINVAAALAESNLAKRLYVGFNAEEASTFPDNSQAFVQAINKSLHYSTQNHVEISAPSIKMVKTDIVRELKEQDFDFRLIWSCYLNGPQMCGRCESCQRLKRALQANGLKSQAKELFLKD